MASFADQLATLCATELAKALKDPEVTADMIERLSAALGMTIAVAARGDPATIDRLMAGAEGYAHAEAVEKARVVNMMLGAKP